ncbi:MAG: VOC family protein [Phycisphaerales bacterium]
MAATQGSNSGPTPGTLGWLDLTADDASGLRDFYAAVVGWTAEDCPMDGYSDYIMKSADGEAVAGVCHARGANEGMPSGWLPYVVVVDIDRAVAECTARGGEIVAGPMRSGDGTICVVRDPSGAAIALYRTG